MGTLARVFVVTLAAVVPVGAQVLDRVMARVDSVVITRSDVRAAIGFGLATAVQGPDPDRAALPQLIERQVILAEVARFPPPEPTDLLVAELVERMKEWAGLELETLVASTGSDDERIRELARETLRIRAYLRQRFGAAATLEDAEVRRWLQEARTRVVISEVRTGP